MRLEQRLDFTPQFLVAVTTFFQKCSPRVGWKLKCSLEYCLDLLPTFWRHTGYAARISRFSHALAVCHCRSIVRGETPITSAVSSTDNPLKKRSSTIRLFPGSIVSSLVNASSSARRLGSRSEA